MASTYPPLISVADLKALRDSDVLILVDAGAQKREPPFLDGAVGVDLETQLSHIKANAAQGGRHPLPTIGAFAKTLGRLGIGTNSHVVVYDNMHGANAAARFWWMLTAVGHAKVQVLNGGAQHAIAEGYPQTDRLRSPVPAGPYPAVNWQLPVATMAQVEEAAQSQGQIIIDVRYAKRYAGEFEPIDLVAGHIPNATNVPYAENLDTNGCFLPSDQLQKKYSKVLGNISPNRTIVHCGSGVTACHTLLAMAHAQMALPRLYVGSWSEWSRNGMEMVTKGA